MALQDRTSFCTDAAGGERGVQAGDEEGAEIRMRLSVSETRVFLICMCYFFRKCTAADVDGMFYVYVGDVMVTLAEKCP